MLVMSTSLATGLPSMDDAVVVVPAPGDGPGNWAGAASAVLVDGVFWLTWRTRRPLTEGRGVSVVIARSEDGITFEQVAEVEREVFDCESLERPVLLPVAAAQGGGWRLYLSCAVRGRKGWWVDTLTAATPEELPHGRRQRLDLLDDLTAVKDPVITVSDDGAWEMWLCCHPLEDAGHEDRMTTRRLTSADGLAWEDHGQVIAGRPGAWDARGARVTTPLGDGLFLYDGRPDAASNWYETTGVARWDGERLVADDELGPIASPYSDGAFRYASAVRLPDGRTRYYVEAARPDGAHDLVTVLR
jgi:hypothetical protein